MTCMEVKGGGMSAQGMTKEALEKVPPGVIFWDGIVHFVIKPQGEKYV